jgi:hypothetical protein
MEANPFSTSNSLLHGAVMVGKQILRGERKKDRLDMVIAADVLCDTSFAWTLAWIVA